MRAFFASCTALALVSCSSDPTPPVTSGASSDDGGARGSDASAILPSADGSTSDAPAAPPPTPSGCIQDVSPGDHVYTCEGLSVDARIPARCEQPGCGVILELHGDTGNGMLMDAHTKLRDLGAQNGYVVVAPTGPPYGAGQPGSTWTQTQDASLVRITRLFASVFRADDKKIHVTGFSRGGFVTWRLLCDASGLFASAAPAAAGNGNGEVTCFSNGRAPQTKIPILFLTGRTDGSVPYSSMTSIRNNAIASYAATGPSVLASDANYTHNRWTSPQGVVIETFDHAYETVPDGPWAAAKGHCFPGSTMDPYAPQYAVPCKGPNAFTWGQEVMTFFLANPKK